MIDLSLYNYIDLAVTFVIGLLIGLAIKKGVVAFALVFVALILASFVGLTFLPSVPPSKFINLITKYFYIMLHTVNYGTLIFSLSLILFLLGLVVGFLKG
ncbi:MAG: hypothetical protein M1515_01570 [Candidatus Thermoplasmatota archaeon]|jgi:hypothetical protein|nr:hypothetical protein [Candidatus Thermoplasmatota archaeon]